MGFLKWYSIILISIASLINLFALVKDEDGDKRVIQLISILIYVPMLVYLILT